MFTKTLSYSISFIILNIFVHSISSAQGTRTEYEIRLLKESDKNSYIVLSAPADFSGVVDFKLPPASGTKGQILTINSAGKMEWITPAPAVPVGTIMQYVGDAAPSGWLMCDGRVLAADTIYDDLRAVIGTKYGGGTENRLPDLRAKFPLGKDATKALGAIGGEETVTLDATQMPSHRHTMIMSSEGTQVGQYNATVVPIVTNPPKYLTYLNVAPSVANLYKQAPVSDATKKPLGEETISNEGGGQPHNNMPPYVVVNYIIKY